MSVNWTIGLYYFDEPTGNGASYWQLLRNYILQMQQGLPPETLFQHYRALKHYRRKVLRYKMNNCQIFVLEEGVEQIYQLVFPTLLLLNFSVDICSR